MYKYMCACKIIIVEKSLFANNSAPPHYLKKCTFFRLDLVAELTFSVILYIYFVKNIWTHIKNRVKSHLIRHKRGADYFFFLSRLIAFNILFSFKFPWCIVLLSWLLGDAHLTPKTVKDVENSKEKRNHTEMY